VINSQNLQTRGFLCGLVASHHSLCPQVRWEGHLVVDLAHGMVDPGSSATQSSLMALNPMSTVVFIRVEALDWAMAGPKGLATLLPVVSSSLVLRVVNSGVVLSWACS
jgi:hypothetical protein